MPARRAAPIAATLAVFLAALAGVSLYVACRGGEPPAFVDLGPVLAAGAARAPAAARASGAVLELDFTRERDRAAVRAGDGAGLLEAGDAGARVRVDARENRITIDLPEWSGGGRDASAATLLLLEIGVSEAHDVTRLYWTAPGAAPDESRSLPIAFPYDGRLHTVPVPLEDSAAWTGPVASFHVRQGIEESDLAGERPVVTLGGIRLLKTTLAERFAIESGGAPAPERPALRSIRIGAETRPAALAPAPSRFESDVVVPKGGPRLDAAIALHPAAFGRHAERVEFVATADGEVLFSRSVDPANPADGGWIDVRADLSRFAGRRVRLALETRGSGGAAAYALLARPAIRSAAPPGTGVRGAILVSLDTLRADRLGCYGRRGEPETTPRLDALAAESVLFARAISSAPETIASHASLFTACTPPVHGLFDPGIALADDVVTLADRFSEAGFATAAFVEGGNVSAAFGFSQGFDTFVETERGARGEKRIEETIAAAEKWLAANADRPFFLFVHTYEAHTPYDPPEPLRKLFDPDYEGPYATAVSWGVVQEMLLGKLPAGERDYDHVRRLYDAGVRHVDASIGGFVDRLRADGTLDRSLLAITSDHGEDFFDHFGFATHGHTLYDELLHVPLLVRLPGNAPRVVEEPVELLSLGPTILDVAGLEPLPSSRASRVQGTSFAGALRGERQAFPEFVLAADRSFFERQALRYAETKFILNPTIERAPAEGEDPSGGANLARDIRAILSEPRFAWTGVSGKLAGWLREVEIYDLRSDPREQRNLAPERTADADRYRRLLGGYLKSLPPVLPHRTSTLGAADLQRLQALGYITGKAAPKEKPRPIDPAGSESPSLPK